MRTINGIVSVKNAFLVFNNETNNYHLFHYDTEIAIITKQGKIVKALWCSPSSTRAIYQLTDYLKINRDVVKKSMVKFTGFVKYTFGTDYKPYKELINNE